MLWGISLIPLCVRMRMLGQDPVATDESQVENWKQAKHIGNKKSGHRRNRGEYRNPAYPGAFFSAAGSALLRWIIRLSG